MLKTCAIMAVLGVAVSGCATNPFAGLVHSRPADAVEGRPASAQVASLLRVADATSAAGDMGNAIEMYRRALEAEPQNVIVLDRLGGALLAIGENTQAVEVYRKAIAHGGGVDPREGLAKALIGLDQPQAAISHLEAALELQERASSYNAIGVAKDLMGDHGAAQAYYRTGLDVEPGNLSLSNNLGLSLAVSGKHAEAIDVLRRAASDPRAKARNRLNLALVYGLAGEAAAAAATARLDLDEAAVQRNLAFYETLRALNDSRLTIRAIGTHNASQTASIRPVSNKQTTQQR